MSEFCYAGAWVAPAPFIVVDCGTVLFANDAALRVLGHSDASALIGKGHEVLLHPDLLVAARARQELVASASRRFPDTPTKVLTADGGAAQHSVDLYPIEVEGRMLTAVEFDISGWPQTDTQVASGSPARGRVRRRWGGHSSRDSSTPILIQSLDTILFVNRIAREQLGVTDRTEIEGLPILSIAHPDGLFAAAQRVAFVFGAHQRVYKVPTKLRCPDGRSVRIVADAYPVSVGGHWAAFIMTRSVHESE